MDFQNGIPSQNGIDSSTKNNNHEIRDTVGLLIIDRDNLNEEVKYARSTILQLEEQNKQFDRLLCESQLNLKIALSVREMPKPKSPLGTSWIGGTWLSSSAAAPLLGPVEAAWQSGQAQRALILLSPILQDDALPSSQYIEAKLLLSAILRCSGDPNQSLRHIEAALQIALEKELHELIGKAHFHRGLCYLHLERYADARWCFVLGAHLKGHGEMIDVNREHAELKARNLPAGHVGRTLNLRGT